jgi:hypothetical protein
MALWASVHIGSDTPIHPWDRNTVGGHVTGLTVDHLDIHLGAQGDDAAIVAACDHLITVVRTLQDAARERIYAAEIAAIDAESPAEGHVVVAEWTRHGPDCDADLRTSGCVCIPAGAS